MKNFFLIFFISVIYLVNSPTLLAQSPLDTTSSFEDQRQRVNQLLNERNRKFGEYDTSLQQKTGIFGLFKSKNDMQKSIDILKQIVLTDNNIFVETRRLLELKDSERKRFEQLAASYDNQVTAYMKTISKLQAHNEALQQKINTLEQEDHQDSTYIYLFILFTIALLIGIIYLYWLLKLKNVTKV